MLSACGSKESSDTNPGIASYTAAINNEMSCELLKEITSELERSLTGVAGSLSQNVSVIAMQIDGLLVDYLHNSFVRFNKVGYADIFTSYSSNFVRFAPVD